MTRLGFSFELLKSFPIFFFPFFFFYCAPLGSRAETRVRTKGGENKAARQRHLCKQSAKRSALATRRTSKCLAGRRQWNNPPAKLAFPYSDLCSKPTPRGATAPLVSGLAATMPDDPSGSLSCSVPRGRAAPPPPPPPPTPLPGASLASSRAGFAML